MGMLISNPSSLLVTDPLLSKAIYAQVQDLPLSQQWEHRQWWYQLLVPSLATLLIVWGGVGGRPQHSAQLNLAAPFVLLTAQPPHHKERSLCVASQ